MNTQVRRYAAELAAAPDLHRALGLARSCRELVAKIGTTGSLGDFLACIDDGIIGLVADIEIAATEALADASDAHSDWLFEQRETENAI